MQKIKFIIVIALICFGFSTRAIAQFGFSHEIGAIAGPIAFQSDYGQRNNSASSFGNSGYGIGLIHYLNFSYKSDCSCYTPETFFNDHFKLRSELSYNKTNFKHFGEWVDDSKQSLGAKQLRAMRGSTAVTNIGMQLEFYPFSIRQFTVSKGSFAPFISLGGQFSFYSPTAYSEMGAGLGQLSTVTPTKFIGAFDTKGGTTWSVVSSIGTRYKLNELSDLMVDLRMQYYYSNWVDGLSPNPNIYAENKSNDWLVWLNFGYIYYLQ